MSTRQIFFPSHNMISAAEMKISISRTGALALSHNAHRMIKSQSCERFDRRTREEFNNNRSQRVTRGRRLKGSRLFSPRSPCSRRQGGWKNRRNNRHISPVLFCNLSASRSPAPPRRYQRSRTCIRPWALSSPGGKKSPRETQTLPQPKWRTEGHGVGAHSPTCKT